MLSAIGDAVHAVQDALPLPGKSKDKGEGAEQDIQEDNTADAPAGQEEEQEETAPEFTTTSKAQEGGTVTTVDNVPPPSDQDTSAAAATPEKPPAAAPAPTPLADTDADTAAAHAGPMNQLGNLGGGSVPLPATPKKWRKDRSAWHPDVAGVHYPPG